MSDEFTGGVSWNNGPRGEAKKPSIDIIRSGKKHGLKLGLLCVSSRLCGTYVHFGARTEPCVSDNEAGEFVPGACAYCEAGQAPRWVGYFGAYWSKGKRFVVCEVTPGVVPIFNEYVADHQTLRGAVVHLNRKSDVHNSPLTAFLTPYEEMKNLPPEFDVKKVLYRVWRLLSPEERAAREARGVQEVRDPGETAGVAETQKPACVIRTGEEGAEEGGASGLPQDGGEVHRHVNMEAACKKSVYEVAKKFGNNGR